MRSVHRELEAVRGQQDPLDEVARRIAKRYRLICFDEFHVSDVADAMILYRLLLKLFEHGTSFIMTSNYEPSTLYPDGLHRDRILPAIKLIQERMDILNRSEEHTSELQSLMRISYAVFCLKKKNNTT